MRKYGVCLAALAAVMLIGPTAVAAAHAGHKHAKLGKQDFIVIRHHNQRVSLYVQRSHRSGAHAAACEAGMFDPKYCSAPVQQDLFGAYAWNAGHATFGSSSSSTCKALGWSSAPCGVYTRQANTLILADVSAAGQAAVQSIKVTCIQYNGTAAGGPCPVTFNKVKSENMGGGDSEVWYADATNVIKSSAPIFVTATAVNSGCSGSNAQGACDVSLQAITFANAITSGATSVAQVTGIGASNACYSTKGAPSCSLTTTEPYSQVWASLNNPSSATIPTWPSNQFAVGVADRGAGQNGATFYSQFLGTCKANADGSKPCTTMSLPASGLYQNPFQLAPTASPAGTKVTINDTAPTNNAFNEVVVEIL